MRVGRHRQTVFQVRRREIIEIPLTHILSNSNTHTSNVAINACEVNCPGLVPATSGYHTTVTAILFHPHCRCHIAPSNPPSSANRQLLQRPYQKRAEHCGCNCNCACAVSSKQLRATARLLIQCEDKPDHYLVQHSIRKRRGMSYIHYRMCSGPRWTIRESLRVLRRRSRAARLTSPYF